MAEANAAVAIRPFETTSMTDQLETFEATLINQLTDADWDTSIVDQEGMVTAPERGYVFFLPRVPIKKGLIRSTDVQALLDDPYRQILSIGAGPAFLEQFIEELGVSPSQIWLADISSRYLPYEFPTNVFDMEGEWPYKDTDRFSLILFPQALGGATNEEQRKTRLIKALPSALKHLTEDGEIRLTGVGLQGQDLQEVLQTVPGLKVVPNDAEDLLVLKKAQPVAA